MPRRRCALDHQALRTGWPPRKRWHARKDSNLRRNPVLEAGALPLSYARVAGEIGIEPMASCASDRRSTHSELLADLDVLSGPGRSRTDRLRIASAVLSRTELQAQGPAAIAGERVFNYARTGVNSSERPMRTDFLLLHLRNNKEKARIGPQQIESNETVLS